MGASVQPVQNPTPQGDRISRNVSAIRAQGGTDDDVEQYLTQVEGLKPQASAEGPGLAAHVLNTFNAIPGVERLEASAAQGYSHINPSAFGGQPISYAQSINALRGVTGQISPGVSAVERIGGSLALLPFLSGLSAIKAGAALGGADAALSADDESLGQRAFNTAAGTAVGGLLGKYTDQGVAAVRGLLSPTAASTLLAKQAARAASAKTLYATALAEGKANAGPVTQKLASFLAEPDIAEIVGELQSTRPFANTPAQSPEMLDAVYKTLSDRAGQLAKAADAVTPTRPNIGRFRMADVKAAQNQALDAYSGQGGPMPSYQSAVDDFASRTREMDALRKGYEAIAKKASGAMPTAKQLTKSSPEAVGELLAKMSPEDQQAATQGVLGGVKTALTSAPLTAGRRAIAAAPSLLRLAQPDALPIGMYGTNAIRAGLPANALPMAGMYGLLKLGDASHRLGGLLSPDSP